MHNDGQEFKYMVSWWLKATTSRLHNARVTRQTGGSGCPQLCNMDQRKQGFLVQRTLWSSEVRVTGACQLSLIATCQKQSKAKGRRCTVPHTVRLTLVLMFSSAAAENVDSNYL